MAGDLNLLKSFVDGQSAGAQTYVAYPADHDTNYTGIETAFNSLNTEFKAFGGQNAALVLDLVLPDSGITQGFLGAESFQPITFATADTQVVIPIGVAIVGGLRQTAATGVTLTGSGALGTRWVALNSDGTITLETSVGQGILDLWQLNWTGTDFDIFGDATPPIRLPLAGGGIFVEAEDLQAARVQEAFGQGTNASIPAFTYDQIALRIDDLARILGGDSVSAEAGDFPQATLNGIAFAGTAALPALKLGDGTTYDATTGIFGTPASNRFGLTVKATELVRFVEAIANEPQALFRAGTNLGAPMASFLGDVDSGVGWVSADEWRLIAGGLEALRIFESGTNPGIGLVDGTAANPGLAFQSERDKGLFGIASDIIGLSTNGTEAARWNTIGFRTSPTQGRCSATRTSQTGVVTATPTSIILNTAEQYDQGTYHDLVTNADRMTIPTNGGGNYSIKAQCRFDESTAGASANSNERTLSITVDAAVVASVRVSAAAAGDTILQVSVDIDLVATNIVRMEVTQDSTANMEVDDSKMTLRLED